MFSSLLLTGAALAGSVSDSVGHKGEHKGEHVAQKAMAAAPRHVKPQAPIVMGRSVSAHHKSKLHHVKVMPSESDEIREESQL